MERGGLGVSDCACQLGGGESGGKFSQSAYESALVAGQRGNNSSVDERSNRLTDLFTSTLDARRLD